ncbi:reverse transcriptase domain-containing protein [Tanacetum coccineum]
MVVEEEGPTWMTLIRNYLEKGMLPEDLVDARTLMEKIRNYTLEDGVLHRKSYLVLLMRACDDFQAHAFVPKLLKADMILVKSAWLFIKWGMDIVGPLSEGPRREKYLIVAIYYFTKWTEAKPVATITDMLEERREITVIREARYKQPVKKYYNKKVRHVQFKVGEFVLRKNEASKAANTGKLGPTWKGPYKFIKAF